MLFFLSKLSSLCLSARRWLLILVFAFSCNSFSFLICWSRDISLLNLFLSFLVCLIWLLLFGNRTFLLKVPRLSYESLRDEVSKVIVGSALAILYNDSLTFLSTSSFTTLFRFLLVVILNTLREDFSICLHSDKFLVLISIYFDTLVFCCLNCIFSVEFVERNSSNFLKTTFTSLSLRIYENNKTYIIIVV